MEFVYAMTKPISVACIVGSLVCAACTVVRDGEHVAVAREDRPVQNPVDITPSVDQFAQRLLGLRSLSYHLKVVQSGTYPDGREAIPEAIADVDVFQTRLASVIRSPATGEIIVGCPVGTSEKPWIGYENVPPFIDMMCRAEDQGIVDGLHKYSLNYGDDEFLVSHTFWVGKYLVKWSTVQDSNPGRVIRMRTYSNYKE